MKRALIVGGYVLFFLVCVVLFFFMTFPNERLERFIEGQAADLLGADKVTVEDASLMGLGGIEIGSLRAELPPLQIPGTVPGVFSTGPPRLLEFKDLEVSLGLSGAMSAASGGPIKAEFSGTVQRGTVENGHFLMTPSVDGEPGEIRLKIGEMKNVGLGSEQLFQALFGKDIVARASGSLDVSLPLQGRTPDITGLRGNVALSLRDTKLITPIFDLGASFGRLPLSSVELGDVTLKVEADQGKNLAAFSKLRGKQADNTIIHIIEANISGVDLEAAVDEGAMISIGPRGITQATLNVHAGVRVTDAFIDKKVPDADDPTKMTTPNSAIRLVLQQPRVKRNMKDGVFGVSLSGALRKPSVRLEKPKTLTKAATRRVNIDRPDPEPEKEVTPTPEPDAKANQPLLNRADAEPSARDLRRAMPGRPNPNPGPNKPFMPKMPQPAAHNPTPEPETPTDEGEEGFEGEEAIEGEGEEGTEREEGAEGEEGIEGEEGFEGDEGTEREEGEEGTEREEGTEHEEGFEGDEAGEE